VSARRGPTSVRQILHFEEMIFKMQEKGYHQA
jgi:hypothetical protein